MVDHIHIEVPIIVSIEKSRLERVARIIESKFFSFFGKGQVAFIDVQKISALGGIFDPASFANINIQPAVMIDVDQGHSIFPSSLSSHPGFFSDVFKLKVPLIE